MKKFIILGAVVATAFLSSCKKNYNCVCKNPDQTIVIKDTKSKATTSCAVMAMGHDSCEIK